MTSQLPI
ncbi:hypothetical protein D049_3407A, partial [Vibrio parahaemolyticus VPTS-2010]